VAVVHPCDLAKGGIRWRVGRRKAVRWSTGGVVDPGERQAGESVQAFVVYRDLGLVRSVTKVVRELDKSRTVVGRWSRQYGWVARASAYGREQDRLFVAERAQAQARRDVARRHAKLTQVVPARCPWSPCADRPGLRLRTLEDVLTPAGVERTELQLDGPKTQVGRRRQLSARIRVEQAIADLIFGRATTRGPPDTSTAPILSSRTASPARPERPAPPGHAGFVQHSASAEGRGTRRLMEGDAHGRGSPG